MSLKVFIEVPHWKYYQQYHHASIKNAHKKRTTLSRLGVRVWTRQWAVWWTRVDFWCLWKSKILRSMVTWLPNFLDFCCWRLLFCFAGVINLPGFWGIKQCKCIMTLGVSPFKMQGLAGLGLVNIMTSLSVWNLQTSFFLDLGDWSLVKMGGGMQSWYLWCLSWWIRRCYIWIGLKTSPYHPCKI